ncbi:DUF6507 family protein [Streptomyces sp. NPDC042319]|uniref:DUF6507 family protein n=1 Tax=Streptomyces sp. NPDC042319 TaxID=3154332 RepID=UPI0033D3274B
MSLKFDISPSGMHTTGRKTTGQGDDLASEVRTLLDALHDAGCASDAAVAGAVTRFSGDVQQKTGIMSARVGSTVDGAGRATGIFVDGDHEMKCHANRGNEHADSPGNAGYGRGGGR